MSTATIATQDTTTEMYTGLDITIDAPPAWSVPAHRTASNAAGRRLVVVDTETTHLNAFPEASQRSPGMSSEPASAAA